MTIYRMVQGGRIRAGRTGRVRPVEVLRARHKLDPSWKDWEVWDFADVVGFCETINIFKPASSEWIDHQARHYRIQQGTAYARIERTRELIADGQAGGHYPGGISTALDHLRLHWKPIPQRRRRASD